MTLKVSFAEQKHGYDKEQVNEYIRMLSEAYERAYKDNSDLLNENQAFAEEKQGLVQEIEALKKDKEAAAEAIRWLEDETKRLRDGLSGAQYHKANTSWGGGQPSAEVLALAMEIVDQARAEAARILNSASEEPYRNVRNGGEARRENPTGAERGVFSFQSDQTSRYNGTYNGAGRYYG